MSLILSRIFCGKRKGHSHTKIHTYTSKLRIVDEILSSLPKIVDEMISTTMFMTLLFTYLYLCIYQLWNCGNQTLGDVSHFRVDIEGSTWPKAHSVSLFVDCTLLMLPEFSLSLSYYRSMVLSPTIIIIEGAVF